MIIIVRMSIKHRRVVIWVVHASRLGVKQGMLLERLGSVQRRRRPWQAVILLPCHGIGVSVKTCGRVGTDSLSGAEGRFRHFEGCVRGLGESVVGNRGGGDEFFVG